MYLSETKQNNMTSTTNQSTDTITIKMNSNELSIILTAFTELYLSEHPTYDKNLKEVHDKLTEIYVNG